MTLQNTDLFLVNRGGTSHRYAFADLRNDISVSGVAEQVIPTDANWNLVDGPFWRFETAAGNIIFPTVTATEVNMSGLIRITAAATINSWVNNANGNFVFGEATQPPGTGEAIVPFYVQATNRILIGRETPSFA